MKHRKMTTRFVIGLLGIVLALSLTLWMGCGESDIPTDAETSEEITIAAAPTGDRLEFVMAVQERHTPWIMQIPGVVGTATGAGVNGPAVVVFTEERDVPRIPGKLDGVPVITKVTGKIYALKPGKGGGKPPKETFDRTGKRRPAFLGMSTGHPNITAGSIGCRVEKDGVLYALSNNHVYADENQASIDDAVIQPGTYDGGESPDDDIGTLADFEPIVFSRSANNVMDAAIAETDASLLDNTTPPDGYGIPKSLPIAAALNMSVMKYGRTTGQTKGKISGINATVNVGYDTGVARFVNQIVIAGGNVSAGGDSGSLIVVQKGKNARRPVGLLFAGSPSTTIANPIDAVLARFGVSIDGE